MQKVTKNQSFWIDKFKIWMLRSFSGLQGDLEKSGDCKMEIAPSPPKCDPKTHLRFRIIPSAN